MEERRTNKIYINTDMTKRDRDTQTIIRMEADELRGWQSLRNGME